MGRKIRTATLIGSTFVLIPCICADALAASAGSALLKAKQEAESRGYVFLTNRDDIISKAKKEGKLRLVGANDSALPALTEAFKKKYPFLELRTETTRGADSIQRFLLEIKAGEAVKDWDSTKLEPAFYSEYLPHIWKIDLLGMAEHGVLDIPPQMIDPKNRNVISASSRFQIVSFNKNLISPGQVPKSWEDFLKPEFKGRKFGLDPRGQDIATLVPAWGLEKALDFARKIAAQQPVWVQGSNRAIGSVLAGENALFFGPTYSVVKRHQRKDLLGVIQFNVVEPVPVTDSGQEAILAMARNPHAALLWLEFIAGAEGQKLLDQHEPMASSYHSKGSAVAQELKGKKLSIVGWEEGEKWGGWAAKISEAQGMPRAETK